MIARSRLARLFTVSIACCVLLALPASAHAASTPVVRLVNKTFTVQVPASETISGFFLASQRTSTKCAANERALAPGILSSSRYLAGHSFGPAAASAFVTGEPGRAVTKLQLLCVKGGTPITHRRVPGVTTPGVGDSLGGEASGRTVATATCPVGRIAIGAPLSQEYGPGYGALTSLPFGARGWRVTIDNVPAQLTAANIVPAYADVACVRATQVVRVKLQRTLSDAGAASGVVTCAGGRRPLGWGVELGEFTTSTPRDTSWWRIPLVQRAQYLGTNRMSFAFAVPSNAPESSPAGTRVVAHVICGKLPRG
jgi:hypothetical protein